MRELPDLNLDFDLLKNTINSIIENIELWEDSLLYKFSDCLTRVVKKFDDSLLSEQKEIKEQEIRLNEIVNIIFRYYINIIESGEKDISKHYVRGFDDIIGILSNKKRINIERDIIENISLMGSFGKKNILRRFSLFYCTSLIKVKIT